MASKSSGKVDSKLRHHAFDRQIDESTRIFQGDEDTCNSGEDKDDDPVVFFCGNCNLPIGDSLSWAGSDDDESQILLKRESALLLLLLLLLFFASRHAHDSTLRGLLLPLYISGVTENVVVGKEQHLYEPKPKHRWWVRRDGTVERAAYICIDLYVWRITSPFVLILVSLWCSLILDLCCKGCTSVLGMVYLSTPKALDYKRLTFCFRVQQLER